MGGCLSLVVFVVAASTVLVCGMSEGTGGGFWICWPAVSASSRLSRSEGKLSAVIDATCDADAGWVGASLEVVSGP